VDVEQHVEVAHVVGRSRTHGNCAIAIVEHGAPAKEKACNLNSLDMFVALQLTCPRRSAANCGPLLGETFAALEGRPCPRVATSPLLSRPEKVGNNAERERAKYFS